MFDIKFFTLLVFIVINFVIILFVKTRTTTVISLVISHLITILLLSNIVSSYEVLKEVILSLSIYSIALLFLISNYNQHNSIGENGGKIRAQEQSFLITIPAFLIIFMVAFGMFFISKNIWTIKKEIVLKTLTTVKIEKQDNRKYMIEKLSGNFLLKKSSDIILLIVAASSILLVLSKKET